MFLADALERRDDRAGALAAYAAAKAAWPTAQSPDIGTARLHALTGDAAAAGAALARLNATRALDARSDPWHGYTGAQSWKLPAGLQAAEEAFEPLR